MAEYWRAHRAKSRSAGVCEVCGSAKWLGTSRPLCESHFQGARARAARRRERKRALGQCVDCVAQVHGAARCDSCAARNARTLARRREARKWLPTLVSLEGHGERVWDVLHVAEC